MTFPSLHLSLYGLSTKTQKEAAVREDFTATQIKCLRSWICHLIIICYHHTWKTMLGITNTCNYPLVIKNNKHCF